MSRFEMGEEFEKETTFVCILIQRNETRIIIAVKSCLEVMGKGILRENFK